MPETPTVPPAAPPAAPPLVLDDDGFLRVTLGGVTKLVDAYAAYNRAMELRAQVDEEFPEAGPAKTAYEFNARLVELLAGYGFEGVSHRAADRFGMALFAAVDALGKADGSGPTATSPGATAPAP